VALDDQGRRRGLQLSEQRGVFGAAEEEIFGAGAGDRLDLPLHLRAAGDAGGAAAAAGGQVGIADSARSPSRSGRSAGSK
jgi:hypothetical protein